MAHRTHTLKKIEPSSREAHAFPEFGSLNSFIKVQHRERDIHMQSFLVNV